MSLFKTLRRALICEGRTTLYKVETNNPPPFSGEIGVNEEMQTFSTIMEGVRYAWDVPSLWKASEHLEVLEWEIPSSFMEDWNWGRAHPAEHIERCLNADLNYPILVWDGHIVDGCHRAVKTLALGQTTIKAKVIINMPPWDSESEPDPIESNEGVHWTLGDMVDLVRAFHKYEKAKELGFNHPLDF
jgi:hypothetical protein